MKPVLKLSERIKKACCYLLLPAIVCGCLPDLTLAGSEDLLSPMLRVDSSVKEAFLSFFELGEKLKEVRKLQGLSPEYDRQMLTAIASKGRERISGSHKVDIFLVGDENTQVISRDYPTYVDFRGGAVYAARGAYLNNPRILQKEYNLLKIFRRNLREKGYKNGKSVLRWMNNHPEHAVDLLNSCESLASEQREEPLQEEVLKVNFSKDNKKRCRFKFMNRKFDFYAGEDGFYYKELKAGKISVRGYIDRLEVWLITGTEKQFLGQVDFPEGEILNKEGNEYEQEEYYVKIKDFIPRFSFIANTFEEIKVKKIPRKNNFSAKAETGKIIWCFSVRKEGYFYNYLRKGNLFMHRPEKSDDIEIFEKTADKINLLGKIKIDAEGFILSSDGRHYEKQGKKICLFERREKAVKINVDEIFVPGFLTEQESKILYLRKQGLKNEENLKSTQPPLPFTKLEKKTTKQEKRKNNPLTDRQIKIARLLANGREYSEIAKLLKISVSRVTKEVSDMFRKAGDNSNSSRAHRSREKRIDLVQTLAKRGWIRKPDLSAARVTKKQRDMMKLLFAGLSYEEAAGISMPKVSAGYVRTMVSNFYKAIQYAPDRLKGTYSENLLRAAEKAVRMGIFKEEEIAGIKREVKLKKFWKRKILALTLLRSGKSLKDTADLMKLKVQSLKRLIRKASRDLNVKNDIAEVTAAALTKGYVFTPEEMAKMERKIVETSNARTILEAVARQAGINSIVDLAKLKNKRVFEMLGFGSVDEEKLLEILAEKNRWDFDLLLKELVDKYLSRRKDKLELLMEFVYFRDELRQNVSAMLKKLFQEHEILNEDFIRYNCPPLNNYRPEDLLEESDLAKLRQDIPEDKRLIFDLIMGKHVSGDNKNKVISHPQVKTPKTILSEELPKEQEQTEPKPTNPLPKPKIPKNRLEDGAGREVRDSPRKILNKNHLFMDLYTNIAAISKYHEGSLEKGKEKFTEFLDSLKKKYFLNELELDEQLFLKKAAARLGELFFPVKRASLEEALTVLKAHDITLSNLGSNLFLRDRDKDNFLKVIEADKALEKVGWKITVIAKDLMQDPVCEVVPVREMNSDAKRFKDKPSWIISGALSVLKDPLNASWIVNEVLGKVKFPEQILKAHNIDERTIMLDLTGKEQDKLITDILRQYQGNEQDKSTKAVFAENATGVMLIERAI
ncbi:MAG: hypothetical protein KJ893_00115 [Candidatus Omnitrophica bacterium]|nr:hypothetical protein [Candidatus Omnitrophota bacterium]MBU4478592.1 hypothetical protein [Candidatus Omnitrophota bacterium]